MQNAHSFPFTNSTKTSLAVTYRDVIVYSYCSFRWIFWHVKRLIYVCVMNCSGVNSHLGLSMGV